MSVFNFMTQLSFSFTDMGMFGIMAWLLLTTGAICHTRFVWYGVLFMVANMLGFVALYVWLQATYLAVAQLIVYVGGGLVLLLYGTMTTRSNEKGQLLTSHRKRLGSLLLAMQAGMAGGVVLYHLPLPSAPESMVPWRTTAQIQDIGEALMTTHLYALELLAVILLLALIGIVSLLANVSREKKNFSPPA